MEATNRAIEQMKGHVFVAHSWAGVVITEAGNNSKVKGLVYTCAFAPNDTESLEDVAKTYPLASGNKEVQISTSGFLSLSLKGLQEEFAQDLPQIDKEIMYVTQGAWAAKCTTEKISNAAWKIKPSWFIIGTNDHMINSELQRAKAKRLKANILEVKTSHVPMLSQPEKVAGFIIEAANNSH